MFSDIFDLWHFPGHIDCRVDVGQLMCDVKDRNNLKILTSFRGIDFLKFETRKSPKLRSLNYTNVWRFIINTRQIFKKF